MSALPRAVPRTMAGVQLMRHGGPEALVWNPAIEVPEPGPGEALVRVLAAGVNNTDINTRVGWYAKEVTGATDAVAGRVAAGGFAGALDFPETLGLEEAVGAIQDNLKIAVASVEVAFADIQNVSQGVPDAILQLDPFLQHLALITALSDAVIAANDSIEGLVLSEAQAAFLDLSAAIGEFSKLQPNGIDFSPFSGVSQTLEQAASRLDALLAAIQGQSDESTDEVLQEFLDIARDVVPIIVPIAEALMQQMEDLPVSFSDMEHPISVQFFETLHPSTIHIGNESTSGQIELFDAEANPILMANLEQGQFNWDGRTAGGAVAEAGTYYFSVALATAAEPLTITGRMIVKP